MKPRIRQDAFLSGGLVLGCSLLDAALAHSLLAEERSLATVLGDIAAHILLSVACGACAARAAPPFLKTPRRDVTIFASLLATFIPVLGGVGFFIALVFGVTPPREARRERWLRFDLEKDLEEHQHHPLRTRRAVLSGAEIRMSLRRRTPDTADHRFRSVLAIQKLPLKTGIPMLKIAQSDPIDEIRLYAFSRLERMRNELDKRVKEISSAMEHADEDEKPRLHLRLAQSYWELGYLGLAEGAVLDHALKSAHRHAAIACELRPGHAAAEFFLGRILVHLREPARAKIAFARAIDAGYPRVKALSYLAECAFYERDYASVRALLRELDSASPENIFFRPVMNFWQDLRSYPPPPPPGSRRSLQSGSRKSLGAVRTVTR